MSSHPAHTSLAVLRVHRRELPTGAIHYVYTLPGQETYTEDRTAASRAALDSDLLNAAAQIERPLPAGVHSFSSLGDSLTDRYIPEPVRRYLFDDDSPLLIQTDDPEFPWELLRHTGVPLGVFRPVGRTLPIIQRGTRDWDQNRRALLIANPNGDLRETEAEIKSIDALLRSCGSPYAPTWLIGPDATQRMIEQRMQHQYELIHFAVHAVYNRARKGASGILCADGTILDAKAIRRLPAEFAFVFVNGCEGGRAAQTHSDDALRSLADSGIVVDGLAAAFIARGAQAFIGTLFPVADTSSGAFARTFYEQLERGVCFGDALRWVREQWHQQHPSDPTWAGYILYGNPLLTLETVRDPARKDPAAAEAVARAHDSVMLASVPDLTEAMAWRRQDDRSEQFFRRFVADPALSLDPIAADAVRRTLKWVDYMDWDAVARLDLLTGLALVPNGMVAHGLATLGSSVERVVEINAHVFRRGHGTRQQPDVSDGIFRAFTRAARAAQKAGRHVITEDDLAAGLLDVSGTGSLQIAAEMLGIEPRDLLKAARGQIVASTAVELAPQSRLLTTAREIGPKRDITPHKLLRDLRAAIVEQTATGSLPPFVGRGRELRMVRDILTRTSRPHVILRAPDGAGAFALAQALAALVVNDPNSFEVAPLAGWEIYTVRVSKQDEHVGEWLEHDLDTQIETWTLLILHDLPQLLRFEGVATSLLKLAHHAKLKLLATTRPEEYLAIREQFPELVSVFTPFDLTPATPEQALPMVQAQLPQLAKIHGVVIDPELAAVAVAFGAEDGTPTLPGAAIDRLERACTQVRAHAFPDQRPTTSSSGAPESHPSPLPSPDTASGDGQSTLNEEAWPTVTADDLRAAPGR